MTRFAMRTSHGILCAARLVSWMVALAIQVPYPAVGAETAGNVVESFDVHPDGDGLLLPVTIDRQQYLFFVDSGSGYNVVDAKMTPPLPLLAKRERLIAGEAQPVCSLRGLFVGKSRLPADAEAVQIDLPEFRKALGHDICGILGMPYLKSHIMQVDFDRGRLSFLKSVPDSAGRAFPLLLDRYERPMLSIDISEDDSIPFVIDTGLVGVGAAVNLRSGRFDMLYEQGMIELLDGEARSITVVAGYSRSRRGWLRTLALGDTTHRRVGVSEGNESALGLCFLSRYVVTFDFPNLQLYLKPGKRFAEPDRLNLSGLAIWRSAPDGVEIAVVNPNSPGSAAGLKAGDRILNYDGKSVSSISLFKLRTLLATEGLRIRLEVENSAGRREVTLKLPAPEKASAKKAPRKL